MLIGSYSTSLVVISLFVAILASYTALDLAGRIATATGRAVYLWMAGGALAMGGWRVVHAFHRHVGAAPAVCPGL